MSPDDTIRPPATTFRRHWPLTLHHHNRIIRHIHLVSALLFTLISHTLLYRHINTLNNIIHIISQYYAFILVTSRSLLTPSVTGTIDTPHWYRYAGQTARFK